MVEFTFFHNKSGNIDDRIKQQELVHAQIMQIQQSSAWVDHQKKHPGAKLEFVATANPDEEMVKGEHSISRMVSEVKSHFQTMQSGAEVSSQYNSSKGEFLFAGCPCGAIFLARIFGNSILPDEVKQYVKSEQKAEQTSGYTSSNPLPPQPNYSDSGNYSKKY